MTQRLARTHVDRSGLVRRLAALTGPAAGAAVPGSALGTRLGDWLDFNDAMTLFAALHGGKAATPPPAPVTPAAVLARDLSALLAREQARLADDIRASSTPGARVRIKWPQPVPGSSGDYAADYAPYHRYYLAQQREMEARCTALRVAVRDTLAARAPALRSLTVLDAAFDKAFGARERGLLAKIPFLLERRFAQLRETFPADGCDMANGWLATFAREVQGVLLAELEARLQPVAGLIETLSNEEAGEE